MPRVPSCPESVTKPPTTMRLISRGSGPFGRLKSTEEGNGHHSQGANPENPCAGPDDKPLVTRRLISRSSCPVSRHRSAGTPDAIAEEGNAYHTEGTNSGHSLFDGPGDPSVRTSHSAMRRLEQEEKINTEDSNVSERDGKVQFRWMATPKLPRSTTVSGKCCNVTRVCVSFTMLPRILLLFHTDSESCNGVMLSGSTRSKIFRRRRFRGTRRYSTELFAQCQSVQTQPRPWYTEIVILRCEMYVRADVYCYALH